MRSIHHDGPAACRKSIFGLEDRTDFYKFHTNEPTTRSNHELKWEIPGDSRPTLGRTGRLIQSSRATDNGQLCKKQDIGTVWAVTMPLYVSI